MRGQLIAFFIEAKMITAERLKEFLYYNSDTGVFTWKQARSNNVKVGMIAGAMNSHRYIHISIDNKLHKAHRLAWLYMYGKLPDGMIDHINHDASDNRIANLRDVSSFENQHNQSKTTHKSTGTYFRKSEGIYLSHISVNKKRIYLGSFKTEEDAHIAYLEAKKKLHPTAPINN